MKVLVHVQRDSTAGADAHWRVEVDGVFSHPLRRLANGFPFPKDLAALDGIEEVRALWKNGSREDGLREAFIQIGQGTPRDGVLKGFGRYLLETLLGASRWKALLAHWPVGEPLELQLRWDPSEWELGQLFWEAMGDGDGFLAERRVPEVSVVRQVPVSGPPLARGPLALRVLFVVGTDLTDPEIRVGAEYLGLLRHLTAHQRALEHRVLLAANGEDLEEAVKAYQPTVIHFTCHGDWGAIRLKPGRSASTAETRAGFSRWSAGRLHTLLTGTGAPLPTVVVLNACNSDSRQPLSPTAVAAGSVPAASFAVELASLGIPLVVGMAGKVADHACRLFTRRLYESLLDGPVREPVDLGLATTRGRRAGLIQNGDKHTASDWTFSRLIVRADTDTLLELKDAQEANVRARVADTLRSHRPFCDRLESFRDFERWLDSDRRERGPFAIEGPPREPQPVRYGATTLMSELAVHALHAGYVPVLLNLPDGDTDAPSVRRLTTELWRLLDRVREPWGLPPAKAPELLNLLRYAKDPTHPVHPELARELAVSEPTDADVLRLALAIDLAALARDTGCRGALLMLDGIQTWSPALGTVLHMLNRRIVFDNLASPVVVSCRRRPDNPQADALLKDFLERKTVERHRIGVFPAPLDALAYHQYALLRQPPRVPNPTRPGSPELMEGFFKVYVEGHPSRLHENVHLDTALDLMFKAEMLVPADDTDTLRKHLQAVPVAMTPPRKAGGES